MKDKRRSEILNLIDKKGYVKNIDLAKEFNTTIPTIINDINDLELQNLVIKVYGGAKSKKYIRNELSNEEKIHLNSKSKKIIGQKAASLINDGEVIFIDTGTTTTQICEHLINKDIIIVTNGYLVARALIEMGKEFIIVGGNIRPETGAIIGSLSIDFIEKFKFDKAFLGINAFDKDNIYTTNTDEAIFKQYIIKNTKTTYALADDTKKDKTSTIKIADISEVSLITN